MYLRQCTVIIKYGYFMEISLVSHQVHGAETLWMNRYFELAIRKKYWGDFYSSISCTWDYVRWRVSYREFCFLSFLGWIKQPSYSTHPIQLFYSPLFRHKFLMWLQIILYGFLLTIMVLNFFSNKKPSAIFSGTSVYKVRLHSFNEMMRHVLVWLRNDLL
jgi:hypothetical protein